MEEEIKIQEEELIFIKGLENKLNVSEYSELRRIINKYINTAESCRRTYNRQEERIKLRDKELNELYEIKNKQNEQYNNLEIKYQKAISEILQLEYSLDKETARRINNNKH